VSSTINKALWKSNDVLKAGSSVIDFGEILIAG
jgi:hypothetical protein